MHDHPDTDFNPARGIAYGLLLGGLGWLLLGAIIAFADEQPATNCTVTPTVDEQYYASCGPPSEPSHTHDASPS